MVKRERNEDYDVLFTEPAEIEAYYKEWHEKRYAKKNGKGNGKKNGKKKGKGKKLA